MRRMLYLAALIIISIISCAPPAAPVSTGEKNINGAPTGMKENPQTVKEDWQIKWDKVIPGAKKEGKVTIYGPGGDIRVALIKAFNEKYGITVDYLGATGPEVAARILAERRSGLYLPDVLLGASSPVITTLKPSGHLAPMEPVLILPEVTDPKLWWNNELPWVDKGRYIMAFAPKVTPPLIINTEIVKPDEVKSLRNLLDPKWKGRLVMSDPTIFGPGQFFISAQAELLGVDFLRQLAAQEPALSRDKRLIAEWVAKGKYPVGIAAGEAVEELIGAGAPVRYMLTSEPTHMTAGSAFLSLPNNSPHPNASTLFINWLLSKEGQTVYTEISKQQSAREDVPVTKVNPAVIRQPGVKYFKTDTEEFLLKGAEQLQMGRDIFGSLIK